MGCPPTPPHGQGLRSRARPAGSAAQRPIDQVLYLLAVVLAQVARCGSAEGHHQLLFGVCKEACPIGAIPAELAGVARHSGQSRLQAHGHAQTEAVAAAVRLHVGHAVLDAAAQVVAGHQAHEGRAQHLRTVQAATVEQHLAETDVVAHGAEGAGAAAVEGGGALQRSDGLRLAVQRVVGKGSGHAGHLGLGRAEGAVAHLQRLPDRVGQVVANS